MVEREIEMSEADALRKRELIAVLLVPPLQHGGGWLLHGRQVLAEKLHLLRHAPLDDSVVFVQTHLQALSIENLFLHLAFHQALEFFRSRRAAPLGLEVDSHLAQIVESYLDLLGPSSADAAARNEAIRGKQQQS